MKNHGLPSHTEVLNTNLLELCRWPSLLMSWGPRWRKICWGGHHNVHQRFWSTGNHSQTWSHSCIGSALDWDVQDQAKAGSGRLRARSAAHKTSRISLYANEKYCSLSHKFLQIHQDSSQRIGPKRVNKCLYLNYRSLGWLERGQFKQNS